jgi:hypothetical protein
MTMSAPGPETPRGNPWTSALIWTVVALAVAIFAFFRAGQLEEKRTFYLIAGAAAAALALMNGYGAWQAYQRSRTPPKA